MQATPAPEPGLRTAARRPARSRRPLAAGASGDVDRAHLNTCRTRKGARNTAQGKRDEGACALRHLECEVLPARSRFQYADIKLRKRRAAGGAADLPAKTAPGLGRLAAQPGFEGICPRPQREGLHKEHLGLASFIEDIDPARL